MPQPASLPGTGPGAETIQQAGRTRRAEGTRSGQFSFAGTRAGKSLGEADGLKTAGAIAGATALSLIHETFHQLHRVLPARLPGFTRHHTRSVA